MVRDHGDMLRDHASVLDDRMDAHGIHTVVVQYLQDALGDHASVAAEDAGVVVEMASMVVDSEGRPLQRVAIGVEALAGVAVRGSVVRTRGSCAQLPDVPHPSERPPNAALSSSSSFCAANTPS